VFCDERRHHRYVYTFIYTIYMYTSPTDAHTCSWLETIHISCARSEANEATICKDLYYSIFIGRTAYIIFCCCAGTAQGDDKSSTKPLNVLRAATGLLQISLQMYVYGQVTLTFRYGREDEEVMGLKFFNEAIMALAQLYPPYYSSDRQEPTTAFQHTVADLANSLLEFPARTHLTWASKVNDARLNDTSSKVLKLSRPFEVLMKRFHPNAHPFTISVSPYAPPSVQLIPAKEYNGAPIGTRYDVRIYAEYSPLRSARDGFQLKNLLWHIANKKIKKKEPSKLLPGATTTTTPATTGTTSRSPLQYFRTRSKENNESSNVSDDHDDEIKLDDADDDDEDAEPPIPQAEVEKQFLLSDGRVKLEASLDRAVYAHGEPITVRVNVTNNSGRSVKRIMSRQNLSMYSCRVYRTIIDKFELFGSIPQTTEKKRTNNRARVGFRMMQRIPSISHVQIHVHPRSSQFHTTGIRYILPCVLWYTRRRRRRCIGRYGGGARAFEKYKLITARSTRFLMKLPASSRLCASTLCNTWTYACSATANSRTSSRRCRRATAAPSSRASASSAATCSDPRRARPRTGSPSRTIPAIPSATRISPRPSSAPVTRPRIATFSPFMSRITQRVKVLACVKIMGDWIGSFVRLKLPFVLMHSKSDPIYTSNLASATMVGAPGATDLAASPPHTPSKRTLDKIETVDEPEDDDNYRSLPFIDDKDVDTSDEDDMQYRIDPEDKKSAENDAASGLTLINTPIPTRPKMTVVKLTTTPSIETPIPISCAQQPLTSTILNTSSSSSHVGRKDTAISRRESMSRVDLIERFDSNDGDERST
ncbi:unnamed protein product, partial [Trichogramma brassicae]